MRREPLPKCNHCLNSTSFDVVITGSETRVFEENGDYKETTDRNIEAQAMTCVECGSTDIDWGWP